MSTNQATRLQKMEHALTPKEAMLLWLQEAHQYSSINALAQSLKDAPLARYPLSRMEKQVDEAVLAAQKGRPREQVIRAENRALRDLYFLWHLFLEANEKVRRERRPMVLAYLFMQERLHRLVERVLQHYEANETWRQISDELPYPLDHETAAAVDAAVQHYVEPWEQFDESGMVQDWVTAAYEEKYKTVLPFWSYYTRIGERPPLGVEVPTQEELRGLFKNEAAFQQWLAGEDYQFGLADVPDNEFLGRCEAAEAAVRAMVGSGQVEQGWVAELETVPVPFLRTVPLIEGEWVDAYVVELAERAAQLRKKGCVLKPVDDNSPFAWDRVGRTTADGFIEADQPTLWDKSDGGHAGSARFPGKATEMGGRRYLSFSDYANWKGRAVRGKLRRVPGILAASWNAWVAQPDGASLAGVPGQRIDCWAGGYGYSVHNKEEALRLAAVRNELLQEQRTRTLHDLDGEPGYFSRNDKLTGRTFHQEAAIWLELALAFGSQVAALQTTVTRISERYFDATPVLLSEEREELEQLVQLWEDLLEQFNQSIGSEFEQIPQAAQVPCLEAKELTAAGQALAQEQTAYLVDSAKAEALKDMREEEAAIALMSKWES